MHKTSQDSLQSDQRRLAVFEHQFNKAIIMKDSVTLLKRLTEPGVIAQPYNPSHWGSWRKRTVSLRPSWEIQWDLSPKLKERMNKWTNKHTNKRKEGKVGGKEGKTSERKHWIQKQTYPYSDTWFTANKALKYRSEPNIVVQVYNSSYSGGLHRKITSSRPN